MALGPLSASGSRSAEQRGQPGKLSDDLDEVEEDGSSSSSRGGGLGARESSMADQSNPKLMAGLRALKSAHYRVA